MSKEYSVYRNDIFCFSGTMPDVINKMLNNGMLKSDVRGVLSPKYNIKIVGDDGKEFKHSEWSFVDW